jgi:hypothetical protein
VAVPLLERLAADAALQEEVDAASQRVVADQAPAVRSSINGVVPAEADAALRDILDQLPGLTPRIGKPGRQDCWPSPCRRSSQPRSRCCGCVPWTSSRGCGPAGAPERPRADG